jgi:hypothetical protein
LKIAFQPQRIGVFFRFYEERERNK